MPRRSTYLVIFFCFTGMCININNFDSLYWENSVTWNSYKIHVSLKMHSHVLKYRVILNSRVKVVDIGSWINSYKVIFYDIISYNEGVKKLSGRKWEILTTKKHPFNTSECFKSLPWPLFFNCENKTRQKIVSVREKYNLLYNFWFFAGNDLQKVFEN